MPDRRRDHDRRVPSPPPEPVENQQAPEQQPAGDYTHGHPGVPPAKKEKAR